MNKTLIATVVVGTLAISAFGQGTLPVSGGANKIQFTTDGITITSVPSAGQTTPATVAGGTPFAGELNITAFSAVTGTTLTTALDAGGVLEPVFTSGTWFQATSNPDHLIFPSAGSFQGFTITFNSATGSPGANEDVEIVAWAGTATTFAQALANDDLVGFSGSALSGGALGYQVSTGTSSTAGTDVTGASGFNGLVLAPSTIPEPTTIALGGLGAAALLMFRRRK